MLAAPLRFRPRLAPSGFSFKQTRSEERLAECLPDRFSSFVLALCAAMKFLVCTVTRELGECAEASFPVSPRLP